MVRKGINPVQARILILGLAFKENCPDLRNTRVVDIVHELRGYNAQVDVHDPWVRCRRRRSTSTASTPVGRSTQGDYDAVILAVAHRQFAELGARRRARASASRRRCVYDVKYVLPARRRRRSPVSMKVLVTGTAGFIGSHVAQAPARARRRGHRLRQPQRLLRRRPQAGATGALLPTTRLHARARRPRRSRRGGSAVPRAPARSASSTWPRRPACATAAENPHVYVASNVTGFLHVLEGCRHHGVEHLVYASTSSVYGANTAMPFSEHQSTEHPLTLYAATKKANELMAHSYAHLFGLPSTGLRFFTVYGPWGRPDMALFLFTRAILAGEPITVFNHGRHKRSFTYVDDIVEGVIRTLDRVPGVDRSVERRIAGSCQQRRRALSPLQHRQREQRRAAALHRGAGAMPGPQGHDAACCRCRPATCRTRKPIARTSRATSATRRA